MSNEYVVDRVQDKKAEPEGTAQISSLPSRDRLRTRALPSAF